MKEEIKMPIYFSQDEKGNINIDAESITEEFNEKLEEVIKNPKKFLEV